MNKRQKKKLANKEWSWYEPEDSTPREQCPCCDYVTLPERVEYLICPICFWEDSGYNENRIDDISGPNHMTLREARANFIRIGACDEDMLSNVISVEERKQYQYIERKL